MPAIDFTRGLPPEYYILDVIYQVKTVDEALRTQQDVEMFGTPTTGFAKYDNQLIGQKTICHLSIDRMSRIHENGYYIGLMNPDKDATNIYLSIQNYLEAWLAALGRGVNKVDAPFDILYRLERFAQLVYPSAAPRFMGAVPDTQDPFHAFVAAFETSADLGTLTALEEPTPGAPLQVPPRNNLQDALIQHQARRMR